MADAVDMLNLLQAQDSMQGVVGWRDGRPVTRAEFAARAGQWQALLLNQSGMRFALYFSDSIEFAAALFGAWHAGKTVYLPSDALPATCAALRPAVDAYLGEFPPECAPLVVREANCGETKAFAPLRADFAGLVVYTSGSTGAPQAIPKKLSQLATEVATIERLFGKQSGGAEVVATVSHQHIYGLLFKALWPLASGRPIHALSLTYPEELAQTTAARDCVLISSPAHLKRLPDSPAWTQATHRIRAVFSSGGPLPLEVALATATLLGRPPIEVFGSSETGGIAWRRRDADGDEAWTVMPGVETRIAAHGELEIRSPHLPDGGWLRTSDRARPVADGRLVLGGRVDRVVKIEEKRISLDLIEARLMQSALVREARVFVIEGKRQCVAAFIVLSDAGRTILSESGKHALSLRLREQLADAVERVALPRRWRYLEAYPVNAQGKTTQAELLALLDEKPPVSPKPVMPRMRVLEKDPQRVLLELTAPRELAWFEGHFPTAPILPGVVQVEWALLLAREHFALPPLFRGMHALKFQRVIRPEAAISLELLQDVAKASVTFKYFSPAGAHASGRLMFGTPDV